MNGAESSSDALIEGARRMLGPYLRLDVAFVSQLGVGLRVLRHVDAANESVISVGDGAPIEDSYCRSVVL